ncbi:MAG TPA: hypothetical protein VEW48_12085 [Thermoanaerobaculia bacterium]|nr:hypothetical protein [Thermoanaerobaculia bacterium]
MSRTFRFALCAALALSAAPAFAQNGPLRFFPITPCRVADTRQTGGPISAQTTRNFTVQGVCGIPTNAKAVVLNATIVGPATDGYLTLYPSNVARPVAANLTFRAAEPALGNGAIVGLATAPPNDLSAYVFLGTGTSHLVLDTTGYFCKVDAGGACIP